MLRIEQATIEDLVHITDLARTVWWDHFPGIILTEQIEYMLSREYAQETMVQEMETESVSYVKLLTDEGLIGFASYGPTGREYELQLHRLYIHPRFQRMGHGSALLRYVREKAIQDGYKRLILAVNKNNINAVSAYLRNGFVIEESVTVDIGGGFYRDDYMMKQSLTG